MLPQRPSGQNPVPAAARKSGPIVFPQAASFDAVKARVLAKLEDRLDPTASKRMPASLLRQSLRQNAEQIADQEAARLPKADRDRLVDEVLAEALGYGPLEELFNDPAVREVMVTGPHAVIARREPGHWVPTNVKFRDEEHVRSALDRLAARADPVGGVTTSLSMFDLKLPNGFRVVAVIPPSALGKSARAVFVRTEPTPVPVPEPTPQPVSGRHPVPPAVAAAVPPSRTNNLVVTPAPVPPESHHDPLARHRKRITERLIAKLAALGVYDLQRVEITELRKAVAAFIREYAEAEHVYLSDADQGRLMLEILAGMNR